MIDISSSINLKNCHEETETHKVHIGGHFRKTLQDGSKDHVGIGTYYYCKLLIRLTP